MAFDDLKKLTTGFIKGWKKGKLKETLKETAQIAMDEKIKNAELEETNRQLIDEIRRLKGEKEKPKIKPASTRDLNSAPKKPHKKKSKKKDLEVDQEIEVDTDKADLPSDAKFVGYRDVVIQDLIISRNNIRFKIKRYYSKLEKRVIEGQIPAEYQGSEFGARLRSFILYQYYKCRVPHRKIQQMLADFGIEISSGSICRILNKLSEDFEVDLKSARKSGLKRDSRVHIDETGARVQGQNAYTFGISHQFFTCFKTSLGKSRWSAISALHDGVNKFLIDDEAVGFIANKIKRPQITVFFNMSKSNKEYSSDEFEKLFDAPVFEGLSKVHKNIIKTACLKSFMKHSKDPPIRFLISDEGTNFVDLVSNHQLCWVHEIRKYKLCEVFKRIETETLEKLLMQWRAFYKLMKRYKNNPTSILRVKIRAEFDRITKIKTRIKKLDRQLQLTRENEDKLLLFLKYPQLPLDNNLCERDLRERVIKRKISLQNRSMNGVKAWDLMLSLSSTCRKLDLSFWRYLEDRLSQREAIPYLGKLVQSC